MNKCFFFDTLHLNRKQNQTNQTVQVLALQETSYQFMFYSALAI